MNNTLWITKIQTYVPEHLGLPAVEEVSKTYQRVYDAFDEVNAHSTDEEKAPVEATLDSDDMAAKIVGDLIKDGVKIGSIQLLCDCRSSITGKVPAPSYKVAVLNDIQSVLPFSIQGQAGTEGIQAFLILEQMMYDKKLDSGVVSLVQKLNKGDKRVEENEYILGDGAAALFVEQKAKHGYEILSMAIKREEAITEAGLGNIVNKICGEAGILAEQIQSAVCQNAGENLKLAMKKILPKASLYERKESKSVNFGCADVFITLDEAEKTGQIADNGTILVLALGKTKHVGVLLMRLRKE